MDECSYHQQFGLSLAKGEPGTSIPLLNPKGGGKGNGKLDSSSSGNSSSDEVGANSPAASSANASPVRYYASAFFTSEIRIIQTRKLILCLTNLLRSIEPP